MEKNKDWLKTLGTLLVVVGVGIWVVYAIGRYLLEWEITDRDFLPYHLGMVIPGLLFRYHGFYNRLFRKWIPRKSKDSGN